MIRQLYNQFVDAIAGPQDENTQAADRESALRMATAVLMVDVAKADHVFDDSELDSLLQLIESHFELAPEEAAELVALAREKAEDVVSVNEFTSLLHKHLDETEKERIVDLLWTIAFADGRLDRYEDALVLKISDLMYVNRARVMRLKHDAEQHR